MKGIKIAAISMVRNEADIIESFVRHTLSFSDHLFIFDHNSNDNTKKIIDLLIAEGLPISLFSLQHIIGHEQSVIMTELMRIAFEKGYSLVIPLDADEFLLPDEKNADIRALLSKLPINNQYLLYIKEYHIEKNTNGFILANKCLSKNYYDMLYKVIVGSGFYRKTNCVIGQGNHNTRGENNELLKGILLEGLHLAHFYYRSIDQMTSKVVIGWLSNVCKFTKYTMYANHWGEMFYNISREGRIRTPSLKDFSKVVIPYNYIHREMKYTHLVHNNYMYNILDTAENLAESISEIFFLEKRIRISVVIIFTGHLESFKTTFENVCSIDYPEVEFIILSLPQKDSNSIELLYKYLSNQEDDLSIKLLLEDGVDELLTALRNNISGKYIQWMVSGDTINNNKFRTIGAALFNNFKPMFICKLPSELVEIVTPICGNIVFSGKGIEFYIWLFKHSIPDSYALTIPLFRYESLQNLQDFKCCLYDGRFHLDILWKELFAEAEVLVTV